MAEPPDKSDGRRLAALLTRSWRSSPPALACSPAELKELTPLLLRSGAAAFVWRLIRQSGLRDLPSARELQQAYRLYTLQAALHERTIEKVIALLRSVEIEPILIKGWAVARLYPEPCLRPYADIDLCIPPEQFGTAEAALRDMPVERGQVDLHRGLEKFGAGISVTEIYERSQTLPLGETKVRVLSDEDHLRVISLHMLREGAWRPLWLCDIAAAVESRGIGFDWNRCLRGHRRLADWIICSMALAEQLLGADVTGTPAEKRAGRLPRWLAATVLKEWEARVPAMYQRHLAPMAGYLRRPANVLKGLRHRWPNPIEATVQLRGPFNVWPRLPFQLGNYVARTAKFTLTLPRAFRRK